MSLGSGIAVVGIWGAVAYRAPHMGMGTVIIALFAMAATMAVAEGGK